MKKILKTLLLFSVLITSYSASAYNGGAVDEQCKKPRFERFSLPVYKVPARIEVEPESEFSFVLSNKVVADSVKIVIKNKIIKYKIENHNSFYRITSKIPAEYTGKFIRINAFVSAKLECKGTNGWLVKVADKKIEPEAAIKESVEMPLVVEDDCDE
ncbi:MAG: hypothetical protein Q9M50_14070 [Methylococcales bacterium]|nr:hypothetical protein [Methylococcales bacterium]